MTTTQTIIRDFIAAATKPVGPYPVLVLCGPPASGKTTLLRAICDAIDPTTRIRSLPKDRRDAIRLAEGCAVVAFDVDTPIPPKIFEELRALTHGISVRALYTDLATQVCCPVVVTSLEPVQPEPGVWVAGLKTLFARDSAPASA